MPALPPLILRGYKLHTGTFAGQSQFVPDTEGSEPVRGDQVRSIEFRGNLTVKLQRRNVHVFRCRESPKESCAKRKKDLRFTGVHRRNRFD